MASDTLGAPSAGANELIMEVRFKPNARLLDRRGEWATALADAMQLPEWKIVDNRVDVFRTDQTQRGFVAFRNAGYIVLDAVTPNFFHERAAKFLRALFQFPEFGRSVTVERLGVRAKYCTPFDGPFEQLVELFQRTYFGPGPSALAALGEGARIIDIGAPVNYVDKHGNVNSVVGPMAAEQLDKNFSKAGPFPAVGLFVDLDLWQKPERQYDERALSQTVQTLATEAARKHGSLKALILGR